MDQSPQEDRSHWPISILSGTASVINMALPLILVRIVSPEEIGLYKVFFLYLLIVPGISMISGVTSGLAYWAGQRQAKAALQVSGLMILASALLFTVLGLLSTSMITTFMAWDPWYSTLFSLALLGAIAGGFFEEAAISTGRVWTGGFVYAGFEVLRTVAIVIVALLFRDIAAIFLTHAVLGAGKVILTYWYGFRVGIVGFHASRPIVDGVWHYAFPVSLAWVFGAFIDRADQLILAAFITPTEFAFYSIGCLVVPPLLTLEHSITRVLVPQLSESFATGNSDRAARLFSEAVESLAFIFIPAVVGLALFAEPIVDVLFTTRYASAAEYLQLFSLSYLALIFPNDVVPRAKGQAQWILKNFSIFSLISLSLAYLLTREYGAFGALTALLLSKAAMRIYAMYYVRRETGWKLSRFLPLDAFLRISGTCAVLAVSVLVVRSLFTSSTAWFLVCAPLFIALYFPVVLALKASKVRHASSEKAVMILTQALPIGGLERMVFDLSKALHRAGQWQPFVVAYDQDVNQAKHGFIPEMRVAGISVLFWKKSSGFSWYSVLRVALLAARYNTRVIHSHNLGPLIYACFVKWLLLGRISIVHTQHSLLHISEVRKYSVYERFFSRFVDKLVLVSGDMLPLYTSWGIPTDRIEIIQNGVTTPDRFLERRTDRIEQRKLLLSNLDGPLRSRLETLRDKVWLLYLARLHPVKGQAHVITVWNALPEASRAKAALLVVGPEAFDGEWVRIQSLADSAKNPSQIILTGGTLNSAGWYAASDLFISCSEFEGLPLAPLEALSVGIPVLLSDIPGHTLFRRHAKIFNLREIAGGAKLLSELIETQQKEEIDPEAEKRAHWVRENFSIMAMHKRYLNVYHEVRAEL